MEGLTPGIVAKRKKRAEDIIRTKVQEGNSLRSMQHVEEMLREDGREEALPEDFYDCLKGEHLADIVVKIVDFGVYSVEPLPIQEPAPVQIDRNVLHKRREGGDDIDSGFQDNDPGSPGSDSGPMYDDKVSWPS